MERKPYRRKLLITKSIRIAEDLLKRVEMVLWNEDMNEVPFGRQSEFYSKAVRREVERLEGKTVDIAIEDLSELYAEIGKCTRISQSDMNHINETIAVLRLYKSIKGEGIATIE